MYYESQKLGEYTLIEILGRGGFGEVWLAEKEDEFFAIKLPHKNQVDWKQITQEIGVWMLCGEHKNILPLIGARNFDGQIAIINEYAPDGSLEDLLRAKGRLSFVESVEMTIGILKGLQHLHESGIIHRDLKPANILLDGNNPRLTDFGISRIITAESQSETISGTWAYMAPECFDGKRNVQTDIWSVGIILYKLLKGKLPFPQKEQTALIGAIISQEPESLPSNIPFEIRIILTKLLSKQISERYQSISQIISDLEKVNLQSNFVSSNLDLAHNENEIEDFYSEETSLRTPLIPYRKGDKWGFSDKEKNILIEPIYDEVEVFCEGMAKIKKGSIHGFVNEFGHELILDYERYYNFCEGLLAVYQNKKCGFINKLGEEVIPINYDGVLNFSEGLAGVRIDKKGGFIDKKNNFRTPLKKYEGLWDFKEGFAMVRLENKFGFINQIGDEIIALKYNRASMFSEDRSIIQLDRKLGFVDKIGNEVFLPYNDIGHFNEGFASVSCDQKCGFIDNMGRQIIPLKYESCLEFSDGFALVEIEGKYGFVNHHGGEVVPLIYDNADSFSEDLAFVMFDGNLFEKQGFINSKGQVAIPLKYDDTKSFSEGLASVKNDGKWGFVNTKGNEVVPLKYEKAETFKNGIALVKLNGKEGYIGKDGTEYFED